MMDSILTKIPFATIMVPKGMSSDWRNIDANYLDFEKYTR